MTVENLLIGVAAGSIVGVVIGNSRSIPFAGHIIRFALAAAGAFCLKLTWHPEVFSIVGGFLITQFVTFYLAPFFKPEVLKNVSASSLQ